MFPRTREWALELLRFNAINFFYDSVSFRILFWHLHLTKT
jgi:hypothetical protein